MKKKQSNPLTDEAELILRNLQYNIDFIRKVSPYLKPEYFETDEQKVYYTVITDYFTKYNALPSKEALQITFEKLKIKQELLDNLNELAEKFFDTRNFLDEPQWLLDTAEEFCKNRALFIAVQETILIAQGESKEYTKTAIPELMQKALSISFDTSIGHDYADDFEKRLDYYYDTTSRVPFSFDILNLITNGGVFKKTLNAWIAEVNGGKSIMLCNLAAGYMQQGEDVLYISFEMDEMELGRRIDANILDININDIEKTDREKVREIGKPILDRLKKHLVIKQYPTKAANSNNIRHLLAELKTKKGFVPSVIIVDYIGICGSAKSRKNAAGWEILISVSEELRAIAIEYEVIVWTALQFNGDGFGTSEPELNNIAEAKGMSFALDFLCAMYSTEESRQMNQMMFKQLKTRYAKKNIITKFFMGLDFDKMRFYDIPGQHQQIAKNAANTIRNNVVKQSTNNAISTSTSKLTSI